VLGIVTGKSMSDTVKRTLIQRWKY